MTSAALPLELVKLGIHEIPWLGAGRPEVDLRLEPGRIIEGARSNADQFGHPREAREQRRATIRAEAPLDRASIFVLASVIAGLALQ